MHMRRDRVDRFIGVGVGLFACALYLHTSAPGVLGGDSGEFQFVPYVLGIAHHTG